MAYILPKMICYCLILFMTVHGMHKKNTEKAGDDEELLCCICYEKFAVEVKTKCNHKFCSCCVTQINNDARNDGSGLKCPCCRGDLTDNVLEYEFTLHNINLAELSTKNIQNAFPTLPLCSNATIDDISKWLQYDIDVNYVNDFTALTSAAIKGNLNVLEFLITNGANVESTTIFGKTPLMVATIYGHVDIIEALLKQKAEVNAQMNDGSSALHLATANIKIVEILIEHGANVNLKSKTNGSPATRAAILKHFDVLQYLIEKKADMNVSTASGATPLMAAADQGHFELVKALLQEKVEVNAQTNDGLSALHFAIDNIKIVKILIEHGANVNLESGIYESPMIQAAALGHLDVVQYLIEKKADINVTTKIGETLLMVASHGGHFEIVKELLKANPELPVLQRRTDGQSALSLAASNGHTLITEFLCGIADVQNEDEISTCVDTIFTNFYQHDQHESAEDDHDIDEENEEISACVNKMFVNLYNSLAEEDAAEEKYETCQIL